MAPLQAPYLLTLGLIASSADSANRFPQLKAPRDYNEIGGEPAFPPRTLGDLTSLTRAGSAAFEVASGADKLRLEFYRADVVRVWLGWNGSFSDPASADIVVGRPSPSLHVEFSDEGDHFLLGAAGAVSVRVEKSPLRLSMFREGVQLWAETVGLSLNATATYQTLGASTDEYFFGGGMQNGRFSHKGHRIRISTDNDWDDGGNPNAAPFFMSSSGYAVYRNTWSPGYYDFSTSPSVLAHNESRFDAFYFAAVPRDFKALLASYVFVTGRPFMPPIYALGLGDSDCYHNERHGDDTRVVMAVADKYRELDMPGAWFLPNDGYGCGYGIGPDKFPRNFSTLDGVVASLHKRGFETGLWSSTGLPSIQREVAGSGIRVAKTDVGWIGAGYKYAFDAVKEVAAGIENNSDARRFIWTVDGWAGTHRLAVMWTGDDTGSFDYVRWQIPTFAGSGFSAQAHVSGDIDGIFGGSPETYVRDLQFKCLMTVIMVMSGWATNPDKQPWTWGEPFTSINRMFLRLKAQLTPYMYSLSRLAYDTGVPPVRAMALEYPADSSTFEHHIGSAQQFMAGPFFLVAPVYRPLAETRFRDGIYLPAGNWVDYWNGSVATGPATINGYPAPLELLPLFVRAGAIIPMWPEMLYAGQRFVDPLMLDVYPSGSSSFELYEDDGVTREALEGNAFARTNITCIAPVDALTSGGKVVLRVGASLGVYRGKQTQRAHAIRLHLPKPPDVVLLRAAGAEVALPRRESLSALDFTSLGWFFSTAGGRGVVEIRTASLPTSQGFQVEVSSKASEDAHEVALPILVT